jgi:nitrous oxidase accessory protein
LGRRRLAPLALLAALALAAALVPPRALARTIAAAPGAAEAALAAAAAGDTVVLGAGIHRGPLRLERAVVLRGEPGAAIDGGGDGSVLTIVAPGTRVEDLEVRASGRRALTIDSGIQVIGAGGVTLHGLWIHDVLYGVYGERATNLTVEHCRLRGRVEPLTESGDGNGVHLWYVDGAQVRDSRIERFVDGIYLSFASHALIEGNLLQNSGRYGLHTMYCQDNRLLANRFTFNVAGCAIMFSNHLVVERNDFVHNRGPRTYGLLLRDCSDGAFHQNRFVDNTVAIFMDGSNRNRIGANLLEDNGWGIDMFSSCAGNQVAGNSFVNDDYPVALDMRYTNNRFDDGRRGNYWSENAPYDLDADGVSDVSYSPVGTFAFLSKQYPDLAVLAKSPAVAALSVAERVLPALRPSEVVDHAPLIRPVAAAGTGEPITRAPGAGRAWGTLIGFGTLALFGAVIVVRGLRWT